MTFSKTLGLLIIALAAALATKAQSSEISSAEAPAFGSNVAVGKYLDIKGIKMYYEMYGSGEPLLLIHGNGGSISNFNHQISYFATHYTVIAVDSRAQGKSVDTGDSLSFEMMADDFSTLLDKLHYDSCNVLGWSDGGINGILLAIRHPEKVKKLAFTGANLWPDSTAISAEEYESSVHFYDSLCKMPQTPETVQQKKLVKLDLFEPHITIGQLQQIHCPTLVIGGDHDIIRTRHTLLIAESIPGSFLWILPNSSHSTLIDYKDTFNEVVGAFFAGKLK